MALYYAFRWGCKSDHTPTQEEADQVARELTWKGVEWTYFKEIPWYVEVKDKGRGVQYKAFIKYFGALYDIIEIPHSQLCEELTKIRIAQQEAEAEAAQRRYEEEIRLREEEIRLKEEERLRKIREYNGPRRNPYFKWRAFFVPVYDKEKNNKCFTPVEMRSWFTFLQDLYMTHGNLHLTFWIIAVNYLCAFIAWETMDWFQFIAILFALGGAFFVLVYLHGVAYIWYDLISCYIKQLPLDDKICAPLGS